jgi:uncharacterized circularly permuted ATP-grasp superfamily protein
VALLTPGIYNSAYYEHAFLADEMGVELVEGPTSSSTTTRLLHAHDARAEARRRDLPPHRRRLPRPLAFRPDSMLGVPGLIRLPRRQRHLANAVGAGIADDKAVYIHVPEMIRFYLGEEPILKNVPTWRCASRRAAHVLEHLAELVVKEVHGSGGYGMLVGPHATKAESAPSSPTSSRRAPQLHRPADAGAVDLPDLRRAGHGAAPCRPAPLRAGRRRVRDRARAG